MPAVSLQPSASARCTDGELVELAVDPVATLLEHGLVPLVYGDIALDTTKGCTILSTEELFVHLAQSLRPQRILMVGEVSGVFSGDPQRDSIVRLVPEINSRNYAEVERMLSASFGVDVTGGMLGKVRTLFSSPRISPISACASSPAGATASSNRCWRIPSCTRAPSFVTESHSGGVEPSAVPG